MSGRHGKENSGNCWYVRENAFSLLLKPHRFLYFLQFSQPSSSSKFSASFCRNSVEMMYRIVARRFAPQLPKADSVCHEQVKLCSPVRAFATSATKAQDDAAVEVGRSSKDQNQAVSARQSRASPSSFLPGLFSPFYQPASLTHMMDTVDRLFDIPFSSSTWGMPSTMRNANSRMPWDVMEDDKCFKLRVDMPGMSKEEVKVSVEDGDLVIKAEHDAEQKEDDWSSRSYGSYSVRIKLPENVEFSGIKAELKDGVLKVQAPKVEGPKQKQEVQIE